MTLDSVNTSGTDKCDNNGVGKEKASQTLKCTTIGLSRSDCYLKKEKNSEQPLQIGCRVETMQRVRMMAARFGLDQTDHSRVSGAERAAVAKSRCY